MIAFDDIYTQVIDFCKEYDRLSELLTYEEICVDKKLFFKISKQHRLIEPIALLMKEYNVLLEENEIYHQILNQDKKSDLSYVKSEIDINIDKIETLKQKIIQKYTNINAKINSIVLEIVSNSTNDKLFSILKDGYQNFCKENNFSFIESENSIYITGLNAKDYFLPEIGIHKLKDSEFECECKVFVFDNIDESKFLFDEKDVEIITCRSSGAGGQHINTTDSAIKAKHIPSGITAISQDQRSQFQNKERAIERLRQKLNDRRLQEQKSCIDKQRKEQLKNFDCVKIYDITNKKIIHSNHQEINLNDFIKGKLL